MGTWARHDSSVMPHDEGRHCIPSGISNLATACLSCMQVDKIKFELAKGKAPGQNVSFPSILNKASQDGVAPDGVPIKCYHFLVHPATLTTCMAKPSLMEFLVTVVGALSLW